MQSGLNGQSQEGWGCPLSVFFSKPELSRLFKKQLFLFVPLSQATRTPRLPGGLSETQTWNLPSYLEKRLSSCVPERPSFTHLTLHPCQCLLAQGSLVDDPAGPGKAHRQLLRVEHVCWAKSHLGAEPEESDLIACSQPSASLHGSLYSHGCGVDVSNLVQRQMGDIFELLLTENYQRNICHILQFSFHFY